MVEQLLFQKLNDFKRLLVLEQTKITKVLCLKQDVAYTKSPVNIAVKKQLYSNSDLIKTRYLSETNFQKKLLAKRRCAKEKRQAYVILTIWRIKC